MLDPFTLELETPINSYGEMVSELTLKPPTGKDILECGYPFNTERNPRTGTTTEVINVPAVRLLISRCCQIPEGSVDQISAASFLDLVERLKIFFYYKARKPSSTSTSKSADGQETTRSSSG